MVGKFLGNQIFPYLCTANKSDPMARYKITRHNERNDWWQCEDVENGLIMTWHDHHFNDEQEAQLTDEAHERVLKSAAPEMVAAKLLREMADWLGQNHSDKVF